MILSYKPIVNIFLFNNKLRSLSLYFSTLIIHRYFTCKISYICFRTAKWIIIKFYLWANPKNLPSELLSKLLLTLINISHTKRSLKALRSVKTTSSNKIWTLSIYIFAINGTRGNAWHRTNGSLFSPSLLYSSEALPCVS